MIHFGISSQAECGSTERPLNLTTAKDHVTCPACRRLACLIEIDPRDGTPYQVPSLQLRLEAVKSQWIKETAVLHRLIQTQDKRIESLEKALRYAADCATLEMVRDTARGMGVIE